MSNLRTLSPENLQVLAALASFREHRLPGMRLTPEALTPKVEKPRPIVKHCDCGRRISDTKQRCKACQDVMILDIASQIETQDILDAVLERSFPNDREAMFHLLKPHLKFEAVWKGPHGK
jgi:hypothetical protein